MKQISVHPVEKIHKIAYLPSFLGINTKHEIYQEQIEQLSFEAIGAKFSL